MIEVHYFNLCTDICNSRNENEIEVLPTTFFFLLYCLIVHILTKSVLKNLKYVLVGKIHIEETVSQNLVLGFHFHFYFITKTANFLFIVLNICF